MQPFSSQAFIRRVLPAVAVLALVLCASSPAQAQTRWLQTAEVVVPVGEEGPMQALLDTLVTRMENGRGVPLKRKPDGESLSTANLEDQLFGQGLDFTSANRVFINYRFELNRDGFSEQITDMYFIYRPEGIEEADIPIMYLNGKDPAVEKLLAESGTTLPDNAAAFRPFREQIGFTRLSQEQTLVAIGNNVIREPDRAEAEKARLVKTIERFKY